MFDPQSYRLLSHEIAAAIAADRALLDALRAEIRPLRSQVRRIQARSATSISLVATDGGNNSLRFDPFLIQIVRVVDSSNNEYCLEVVTPTLDTQALSARQFDEDGSPRTPLGRLMAYLGVQRLSQLSPMIPDGDRRRPASSKWVQVYRELMEWAVLFSLVRTQDFAADTLIVFDGLLRSKVFAGDLFLRFRQGLDEGIEAQGRRRRRLFLAGVAKHSQVLERYRLAMALERILACDFPAYVDVPRDIEERAYRWSEYARGDDVAEGGEINRFVAGKMLFMKFGSGPRDPIWPVDVYVPQVQDAPAIAGYLLADALNGFPVPFYPRCLQAAHEHAALVEFDFDVLQDQVFEGIRNLLEGEAPVLDAFRITDHRPSQRRTG